MRKAVTRNKNIENVLLEDDAMVCFLIPLFAAFAHTIARKNVHSMKNDKHHLWLGLMLAGGSLFGVIDHIWNRELFLIGSNIASDLLLGATITVGTFVAWALIVHMDKAKAPAPVPA